MDYIDELQDNARLYRGLALLENIFDTYKIDGYKITDEENEMITEFLINEHLIYSKKILDGTEQLK